MAGTTVVRDAVWGDIELGPRELALVDTAAFQRLRRVRQLGFTDLVFPGANHTRFEHSLGVFHVAGMALRRLSSDRRAPTMSSQHRRAFLAAALLHDVGHYPFSHAVEELEIARIRRHEEISRERILSGEIADAIEREWDVDPARVATYVAGPQAGDEPADEADVVLRALLDSALDVDKLDYLVRDARGANVPYGVVDVQRLVGSLTVWRDADGVPAVAVDVKGLSALQSLVFAKHLMFATVYWHHACRSAVAMLLRAVQEALAAEAVGASEIELADDAGFVARLRRGDVPRLTRELAERLRERRLYKRAVRIEPAHDAFAWLERLWFRPERRARLEDEWAARVGGPSGSVLLDIPEPKRLAEGLPIVVEGDEAFEWDRVSGIATDDLDRFQGWVRRIRVFASDRAIAEAVRSSAIPG